MFVKENCLTRLIQNEIIQRSTFLIGVIYLFISCPKILSQEWPHYGGDLGGRKYSILKQITRENVNQLRPTWIYRTGDISDGSQYPVRSAFECTPLVVDGMPSV